MDEVKRNSVATILKRILLFILIGIIATLFCYSCSAFKSVSNHTINLEKSVGSVFEAENQQTVLIFNTSSEALINTNYDNVSGLYNIEQKDNVLLLSKGSEEEKLIFLSLSNTEILWQNKDIILFKWED